MQTVTVKFKENVLQEMDESIQKNNFNSRTEFIREAVRDKMANLSSDEIIKEFSKFYGSLKGKSRTNLTDRQIREICSKEAEEEYRKKFNLPRKV